MNKTTQAAKKKEALAAIKRMRELAARMGTGFEGMTEAQIIAKLRQTREQLWEEKIALRH